MKTKTVEQTYQKLSQREHILTRPDTYVGSVEQHTADMYLYDPHTQRMALRKVNYVPGLYKIYDEILVNAADNKQRDASMSEIRIDIDRAAGRVSVRNNGRGIPVVVHKEHGVYVPELIFGHLLTSSNYDDAQRKVTGGRNGYGAKLANIFSTEFVVETSDKASGLQFKQTFRNNMQSMGKPEVKPSKGADFTRISWVADLAKFGMSALDDDTVALMERRAYDMAGCTHSSVRVYLNGEKLPVSDFKGYLDLFLGARHAPDATPRVFERVSDRWELAVAASDDGFQQVSFVNSIATTKGGTHVTHVADQVVERVLAHLRKKHKGMEAVLKPSHVKNHLRIFINCLIENPAFDSQTKENMTLKQSAFGSKCVPSDRFFSAALNCGVLEAILAFAQSKQSKALKKTDGARRSRISVSKLDDANEAGGRNSARCTLIITEGDSAKSLAVAGLSVIGRDHYGVFPLRGKLLNVRDASASQVAANKEITELKQILGLQQGKDYSDPAVLRTLRYGHLMLMTDQDHDGSHIKGLVINFLHCFWPSLLKHHDFLREFVTPIVKVSKGRDAKVFFTLKEYGDWRAGIGDAISSYTVKYYKGLGTSTAAEAKAYFSDLPRHELTFRWEGDLAAACLKRVFAKSHVEARKEWLRAYDPSLYVDHSASHIDYATFVDHELIHFSNADNIRSIPSVIDGLKPGQRKILYASFKRGESMVRNEVKVVQLAGYVSEHAAYHHGEASLAATIIGLAQTYVGSNNVPLLTPAGQFGTRLMGGKDAASPRYIFTKMPKLTRLIFHPHDDELLEYLEDDGLSIEPRYYVPILPTCLVNGADGIGTGWSTSVPNYNPRDIVESLRALIDGRVPPSLTPWYRGFVGTVSTADDRGSYSVYGVISKVDDVTIHISELPIRKWTQEYKEQVLEPLLQGAGGKGGGGEPILSELRENHTDTTVAFTLRFASAPALAKFEAAGLHKSLKLISHLGTTNMMLFDAQDRISRYESPEAVIRDFYLLRLNFYEKRKLHLAEKLEGERSKLSNRLRFVLAVIDGSFVIANRNRAQLIAALETAEYAKFRPPTRKPRTAGGAAAADAADDDDDEQTSHAATGAERGYDYLLGMALWSLTAERVKSLRVELAAKEAELNSLLRTPPKQLWLDDLDAFETALASWEAEIAELGGKGKGKGGAAAKRPANAKRKAAADDLDWEASSPKKQTKTAAGSLARPIDLLSAVTIPVPAPEVKRQTQPAASESLLLHDRVRMPLRLAPLNPRDHDQYVELHHSCGVLRLHDAAFIPG